MLRCFLKSSHEELDALNEKFQQPLCTQVPRSEDVRGIRDLLVQRLDQLSDAVYWHQVSLTGAEAGKISDDMENWLHIVATCLSSFHDESRKQFSRLSDDRLGNVNEKVIAILNRYRKRACSIWWRLFSSTAKIRQKMGRELRPMFVEIESACQRDFEAWIKSAYESKAKELEQLVNFIRRDAGERIGDEAALQLAGIWEKTQISNSLPQMPKLPSLLVPLLDDSNSLLMQIISPEQKAKEETDAKTAWKTLLDNLSCSQDKAFDACWHSSAMGTWERNCKQTENWVKLCKSASSACTKVQIPHEELEQKLLRLREMKENGVSLANVLHSNPEWGCDEQDLKNYLKACLATLSSLAGPALNFGSAAWQAIKMRIDTPGAANPDSMRKDISNLKDFMELLSQDALGNAADEKKGQTERLDWGGLGDAMFRQPEYTRYRKAVAVVVQTLQAKRSELDFYSSSDMDWEKKSSNIDEVARKAWNDYWRRLAPSGVYVAPFDKLIKIVVCAFVEAFNNIWEAEQKWIMSEFYTEPVKHYNFHYNP